MTGENISQKYGLIFFIVFSFSFQEHVSTIPAQEGAVGIALQDTKNTLSVIYGLKYVGEGLCVDGDSKPAV